MIGNVLRALSSFSGQANKHNLTSVAQLFFTETQKSARRVTGWQEWSNNSVFRNRYDYDNH